MFVQRKQIFVIALLLAILFPMASPNASPARAQTGLEVGFIVIAPAAITGTWQLSVYAYNRIYPYASEQIKKWVAEFSKWGIPQKMPVIIQIGESTEKQIAEEIAKKISEAIAKKIVEYALKGAHSKRVRIGADARPTGNCLQPKFTYRTYSLNSTVSRWDYYPPGKWTINNWCLDFNGDGKTDYVVPSAFTSFQIK